MARNKKYANTRPAQLGVTFQCPQTDETVTLEFKELETVLSAYSDPCELCGSHTRVSLWVNCPSCGGAHDVILRDD